MCQLCSLFSYTHMQMYESKKIGKVTRRVDNKQRKQDP